MSKTRVSTGFLLVFKNNELTDFAKVGVDQKTITVNETKYSITILQRYGEMFNPTNSIDVIYNCMGNYQVRNLMRYGYHKIEGAPSYYEREGEGNTFVYIDEDTFASHLSTNYSEEEFVNILRRFIYTHTKFSDTAIKETLEQKAENGIDINSWVVNGEVNQGITVEEFSAMMLKIEQILTQIRLRQNPFVLDDTQKDINNGEKNNGDTPEQEGSQNKPRKLDINELIAKIDEQIAKLNSQATPKQRTTTETNFQPKDAKVYYWEISKITELLDEIKNNKEKNIDETQSSVKELMGILDEILNRMGVQEFGSSQQNQHNGLPKISYTTGRIRSRVIGQDTAVAKAVLAVYQNMDLIGKNLSKSQIATLKNNILMSGPSGCGKTEIARQLSDNFNVPCFISDTSQMTGSGWNGDDVTQGLVGLYNESGRDIKIAQRGILVLDEIDKIAVDTDEKRSSHNTTEVQQGLLKVIEGGVFDIPVGMTKIPFDTKYLTIISSGAFNGYGRTNPLSSSNHPFTKQDYITYGLMPEFVGRHKTFITLNQLSFEDKKRILMESELSVLKLKLAELEAKGIKVNIECGLEKLCEAIIRKSEQLSDGECGARDLNQIAFETFNAISYCLYDEVEPFELSFGQPIVEDPTKFSMKTLSKKLR